jgi:mannitol-1-/sugar-/sorbitol-6-phosphatase
MRREESAPSDIHIRLPGGGRIQCRAMLLDMDGVLVDSLPLIERCLSEWATGHGLDAERVVGLSPGRKIEELVADVAPTLDAGAEARRLIEREIAGTAGITATPGAARLLRHLPGRAWAVVTSGHRRVAVSRLDAAGLPVPDVLITADDVRAGKPDPEGYLAAADRLGMRPPDCVVIEDAAAGLLAARAAGMRAIAIEDGKGGPEGPSDDTLSSLALLEIWTLGSAHGRRAAARGTGGARADRRAHRHLTGCAVRSIRPGRRASVGVCEPASHGAAPGDGGFPLPSDDAPDHTDRL